MSDTTDELTDEDYVIWSEEFAKREFTQEELDRVLSTWRSAPWREPETTKGT